MHALDEHARDALEDYKLSLAPDPEDVSGVWKAVAEQAAEDMDEAEVESEARRRSSWPGFWLGIAAASAAALVLTFAGSLVSETSPIEPVQSQSLASKRPTLQISDNREVQGGGARAGEPSRPETTTDDEIAEPDAGVSEGMEPATDKPMEAPPAETPGLLSRRLDRRSGGKRPEVDAKVSPADATMSPLDRLEAETRLIRRARRHLSEKRPDEALRLVERHARRFPEGLMAEEAGVIFVGALCERGPAERWRAALAEFERRFPRSPLRVHVRDDCFE